MITDKLNTTIAPNFTLTNIEGQPVRLSDYQAKKHVILVFNRGFV